VTTCGNNANAYDTGGVPSAANILPNLKNKIKMVLLESSRTRGKMNHEKI
jgi:hypothetical protein